jgi:hypothetical protein
MTKDPLSSATWVRETSKYDATMMKPGTRRGPMTPVALAPMTMTRNRSSFRTLERLSGSFGDFDGCGTRMRWAFVSLGVVGSERRVVPLGKGVLGSEITPKAISVK